MRDPPLILVVDDVADNVDILQMRLEAQGYAVATAGDGIEALEKIGELLPDLVPARCDDAEARRHRDRQAAQS